MRDAGREELERFLQRTFPQALPLSRYAPFSQPAVVSFDLDDDLAFPPSENLDVAAERAARLYELVFAPGDHGWVCAVQHGVLQAVLPEPLTIEDVTTDGRIAKDAFVPQPVRRPDPGGLAVLVECLPAQAREHVSISGGHDPLTEPEFTGLADEEGVPYVLAVARVRPRDVDHRRLIRAVVDQDFPSQVRTRLVATLLVVDEDRPAVFDLPDDRYCGVAMPDAASLRPVYESGLAPLNEYRRPEMERTFGDWPDAFPDRPPRELPIAARRGGRLQRWLRRR